MTTKTLSQHIATVAQDGQKIPDDVVSMLHRVTLDAYGLMLSARNTDYINALVQAKLDSGQSTAFGHGNGFTMQDAVLINGTAVHGEDFDDTFEGTPVHISAVIVPTILAIAEQTDLSKDRFVQAMAHGSELICRLALVAPTAIHRQGFHPTAILGAFGASLTASIAYGLTHKQTTSAFGIVGSMASGIIEYLAEGTWTKRMHPGWAAGAGLKSAAMAKAGFIGPSTVFEGVHGLFKAFASDKIDQDFSHLKEFGEQWICKHIAFKPYACGTMTQPFVDCAIQAAEQLNVDDIKEVHALVGEGTVHRLWEPLEEKQNPSTPYSAKFSVPYCIALGILDRQAGLMGFTDKQLKRSDIHNLASKISYSVNPSDPYPNEYVGWIDITTKDGKRHSFKQKCLRGGRQEPMSQQDLEVKFASNLKFASFSDDSVKEATQQISSLFQADSNIRQCIQTLAQIGEKP